MKKGIAPVGLGIIAMIAIWVGVGAFYYFGFTDVGTIRRSVKEREAIKAINTMEWVKRSIPQALRYSFYQASYSIAQRGGYIDLNAVPSYNCIPYWSVFDSSYFSEEILNENLKEVFSSYLREYADSLRFSIPAYSVELQKENENTVVNMKSEEKLKIEYGKFKVFDNANFIESVEVRTLKLFEIGISTEEKIKNRIKDANSYEKVVSDISRLKDELNNEYAPESIEFELIPENLGESDSEFSARILVKITDNSKFYPVFDLVEKTTDRRNIVLNFYILLGDYEIEPIVNVCE